MLSIIWSTQCGTMWSTDTFDLNFFKDKNNAPRAKEAAQKLNEASKILNNPAEREKYDAKRKREESSIITLLPSLAAVVLCAGGIAGLMYLLTRKDGTEKKGGKKGQNQ